MMACKSIPQICRFNSSWQFVFVSGIWSIGTAGLLSLWVLYTRLFTTETVSGWTSLMIVFLYFSSIQFILMGLIGEYIGKIFLQVRGRPGYVVDMPLNSGVRQSAKDDLEAQKIKRNLNF